MSDRAKLQQVILNFFSKVAQLTVAARAIPPQTSSGKVNKWFNLELEELDSVRDDMRQWRAAADVASEPPPPLVIEAFADPRGLSSKQSLVALDANGRAWPLDQQETVLERWIVEFRPDQGPPDELPVVYKRCIVLIRALYTILRLLPAWGLRQKLSRQKLAASPLRIGTRILDGSHPISSRGRTGLSRPLAPGHSAHATSTHSHSGTGPGGGTNSGTGHLASYVFAPVQTPSGTLHVSVSYRRDCTISVDDAEAVIAQQFLDLDRPETRPARPRPTVSFTRPFKSPDAASVPVRTPSTSSVARLNSLPQASVHSLHSLHSMHSMQSLSGATTPAATPAATPGPVPVPAAETALPGTGPATGTPGTAPVPVPRSGSTASFASVVSSASSVPRFSSSFASRHSVTAPRTGSIESRDPRTRLGSIGSTASASSLEPGSGLYVNSGVGEFVRFVDDAQKRSSTFRAAPSTLETSLSKFQSLRASHMQLSESLTASRTLASLSPGESPGPVPGVGSGPASGPGSGSGSAMASSPPASGHSSGNGPGPSPSPGPGPAGPAGPADYRHTSPRPHGSPLAQSPHIHSPLVSSPLASPPVTTHELSAHDQPPHEPLERAERAEPETARAYARGVSATHAAPSAHLRDPPRDLPRDSEAATRYDHTPAVPSRLAQPRRRSGRSRLSFYADDDYKLAKHDSDSDDDEHQGGSDEELLFAMSDMNCI